MNENLDSLKEFIHRAMKMYEGYDNYAFHKRRMQKYYQTEKGKFAKSIGYFVRRSNILEAKKGISWEERQEIGRFYKNCPKGYEVDHIIPVSKGGLHRLSNLQYLTREDNRRKHNKITGNL